MYKDGNHIKHLLDHNYGKPEINQKKNWRKPKKKKKIMNMNGPLKRNIKEEILEIPRNK